MTSPNYRLPLLAAACSSLLAGVALGGHEVMDSGKQAAPYEAAPTVQGSVSAGYQSKYIFRGTNLTPSSDGIIFADVNVHYHGFTLGAYVISQQGSAQVQGARAISEGGGGGDIDFDLGVRPRRTDVQDPNDAAFFPNILLEGEGLTGDALVDAFADATGLTKAAVRTQLRTLGGGQIPQEITRFKTNSIALQDRFNEIDLYLHYDFSVGPIDVTVGNIFFYIDRDSITQASTREFFASEDARAFIRSLSNFFVAGPNGNFIIPTRINNAEDLLANRGKKISAEYEGIEDEQFDRVFVSLSTRKVPYVTPSVTYYQTVYSEGTAAATALGVIRNDEKGGYAEAKLNAHFPLIRTGSAGVTDYKTGVTTGGDEFVRLSLDPYAVVSYSVGDRTDKSGSPLYGWNHFQAGVELVWKVTETFHIRPQFNYMARIADPTLGTNEDEWWGGGKVEVVF